MEILKYLEAAIKLNASDLHFSPKTRPMLRIDGNLVPIEDSPILDANATKELAYSVMEKDQIDIFESTFELDFSYLADKIGGFRVNAYYELYGVAAAFRVIPDTTPTLDELDMPPVFKELLNFPNGLIIVTGPTGSGKSTTLAAMIDYINTTYHKHIITIEDPIEFIHQSKKSRINQRQIHRHTKSFNAALRSALREDPDVILLGELRDLETIRLALTAAETGHLVMSTLHTSSAPRTVSRIVDVFDAAEKGIIQTLLAGSLRAVVAQTLLKKAAGGRVAAFEIMLGAPAIRNLIREGQIAQMYSTLQTSAGSGMCTLDQSLQTLVKKEIITAETAHEVATNRELFKK